MQPSKVLNWVFGFGFIGWAVVTFVTPPFIKFLFTSPVSFGTNCEPAAEWAMSNLLKTQIIGIASFMILGFVLKTLFWRRSKSKKALASADKPL